MPSVSLSGIQVVVFDLDDTLYPERQFAFSGFDAVAARLRERLECPMDPAVRMRELFDGPHRRRVFDQLLTELGCDKQAPLIPEMITCYREHMPTLSLYPDAEAALKRWHGVFQLSLISDGPEGMQQRKLEALGLPERLDLVILTGQWGPSFWKPHPRAFEEVESFFRAPRKACVYLADNAAKDFVAPRQLGWRSVRIRRPDGVYAQTDPPAGGEPDFEVTSLMDVDITD